MIVEQAGQEINEIVARNGWEYFRARERDVLTSLIASTGVVIATGGGAIMHGEVWPQLMASGLVVWLTASERIICQRLQGDDNSDSQRPSLTGSSIYKEIVRILKEREPLYRQGSHLTIDTGSLNIAEIVEIIINNKITTIFAYNSGLLGAP